MTITSMTYACQDISAIGDNNLYTVPTATISDIRSMTFQMYLGEYLGVDIRWEVVSPGGVEAPILWTASLSSRESLNWYGSIRLEAGYSIHFIIVGALDGGVNGGLLVTGQDYT